MQRFLQHNVLVKNVLIFLLFFAVVLVLYYPTLGWGPLWDDWFYIFKSDFLKTTPVWKFWVWGDSRRSWPMFYTVMAWMLKGFGDHYFYYHFISVLLHAINGFLIFHILKKLKGSYAFLLSLIYLVHPLNFFTVAWIIQIKTLLSIFFFLLALHFFLKNEEEESMASYWSSVILFGLSLLSKVVFAPIILLTFFYKKKLRMMPFVFLCLYAASATVWNLHLREMVKESSIINYMISPAASTETEIIKPLRPMLPLKAPKELYPLEPVALSLKSLFKYSAFTVYPWKTNLVQPVTFFTYSNSEFLISIATLFGFLCLMMKFFAEKKTLSLIGISFFVVTIIPLAGLFYVPIFHFSNFVEYWMSVPALGLLLCLTDLKENKGATVLLSIFFFFLGYKTLAVSQEFKTPVAVIEKSIEVSPKHPLVKLILAKHYFYTKEYAKSNVVLLDVKADESFDAEKLEEDFKINLKAINGESID